MISSGMVDVRRTLDCKDCDCSLAVRRRETVRLSCCSQLWLWASASSSAAVASAAAASATAAASAALAAMIAVPAPSSLPSSASLDGRSPRVVRAAALDSGGVSGSDADAGSGHVLVTGAEVGPVRAVANLSSPVKAAFIAHRP